jgi:hypothetical protein
MPTTPTSTLEHDTPLPYEQYILSTPSSWYNASTIESTNEETRTQNLCIVAEFLPRRLAHYEIEYGIAKEQMRILLLREIEKRDGEKSVGRAYTTSTGGDGVGGLARVQLGGRIGIAPPTGSSEAEGISRTVDTAGQGLLRSPLDATPFELRILTLIIFVIRLPYKMLHILAHPWKLYQRLHRHINHHAVTKLTLAFCGGFAFGFVVAAALGLGAAQSLFWELDFCYSHWQWPQ